MLDRLSVFGGVEHLRFGFLAIIFAFLVEFCKHFFNGHGRFCLHLTFSFRLFLTQFFFLGKTLFFTLLSKAAFFFGAEFFFFHFAKHALDKLSVFFAAP